LKITNWYGNQFEKDRKMKILDIITAVLIVVGGLNWGLWGAFQFDLVATIGGGNTGMLARLVYCLVGLAAVYQALSIKGIQSRWHCAAEAK
jgi:uncharacterized membrane protein YuzA (DUF378 family)